MRLPRGLTSRAFTMADLDAVYQVGAAYDIAMVGEPDIDKADIEAYWKTPSFDFARDTRGIFDGDELLALAMILKRQHLEICVHPDHHRRGLGTALADWSESQMRAAGEPKGFQNAPAADLAALAIFAHRGYRPAWTSWILEFPRDVTIPQRDLPEGYAVRPFRPDVEEYAAYDVIQTAFDEWPDRNRTQFEDWKAAALGRDGFLPEKLLVATFHDDVVGAALVVDGDAGGWVEALAVDKDHRNRGIAQVLLANAFAGTRSRGLDRAMLATDSRTGALGLYQNLGMRVTRSYEDWSIEL